MHQKNIVGGQPDFFSGSRSGQLSGKSWKQRITERYGLLLTSDGLGEISCNTQKLELPPGSLVLMKPGGVHQFRCHECWSYLWFHFVPRTHILDMLDWPDAIPFTAEVVFTGEEYQKVYAALKEACQLDTWRSRGWKPLALSLLESVIVRGYNTAMQTADSTRSVIDKAHELLAEGKLNMNEIARACGMSRSSFYQNFQSETGVSPRHYREYLQIQRAEGLLGCMAFSISDVAEKIGMPNPYYFSTRFRKFIGCSPREYRKRISEKHSGGSGDK